MYQYTGTIIHLVKLMNLSISLDEGVPIYRQIVNQIKYMVASGLLKPDEELPAIRTLATDIRVTPNTVVKAYDELCRFGIITKRQGSGCFVSNTHSKFSEREKKRILEQRIDGLLSEAHQLGIASEILFTLIHKRMNKLHDKPASRSASGSEKS